MIEQSSSSGEPPGGWMACTARLRLRLLQPADEAALREITSPPGWIETLATRPGDRTLTPWAVTLRDGGTVAGYCGFLVRPVQGTTLGYAILPQHRGLGLATEAARAAVEWAERHGVDFYASVRPPNPASVRVLTTIGMRLTGSYVDADGQRDIYRRQSSAL
jgi:RimJ/RimL family protein N-acetyltransferase